MMEDNYIAPQLAAEEKRFKYSLIWVEHRDLLRKIGFSIWGGIAGLMILFSLWVMVDTFLIGYESERALLVNMGLNQSTRHNAVLASAPTAVKLSSQADIFSLGDDRYDFFATIENDNENYWLEFDYYFSYGSSVTDAVHGFIYPSESKPLVDLAWESTTRPSSAKVVLENIEWHMIDPHEIADFAVWREDLLDFEIAETEFDSSIGYDTAVGRSTFTVTNNSAYAYWEPLFYVLLYRGESMAGVTTTVVQQFTPGDEQTIMQNWYGTLPSVTRVEVIPEVALLDDSVYMPLTGELQEGLQ
jgi:hypothetical protein